MYKQFNICVNPPDGGKMYIQRINNGKRVPMYHCGNYPKVPVGTLGPSVRRIIADHVMEIVAKTIKGLSSMPVLIKSVLRKKEARKDRLHQNYLKRKASGKQEEYEERTKAKNIGQNLMELCVHLW